MPDDEPPSAGRPPGLPGERQLVDLIAAELREAGLDADLTDDCGRPPCPTALVSTDALVEGRHFDLGRDTPLQVGAQAAVANLSDLAASGGAAGWAVWDLTVPGTWGLDTFRGVVRGFARTCAAHGCAIIGGNLTRTDGPAVISVTVGGPLAGERPFTRDGARPDDIIYVTGPLGDAALGYLDPDPEARDHRHRWRPHLAEAKALAAWGRVSAAMDVSDGLALDLDRMMRASGAAAALLSACIPTSAHYHRRRGRDRTVALTGGEDYVLLFCAPPDDDPPDAVGAVAIGRVTSPDGPRLRLDGAPLEAGGHDHFAPPGGR